MTRKKLGAWSCIARQARNTASQARDTVASACNMAQGRAYDTAARPTTRPAAGPRYCAVGATARARVRPSARRLAKAEHLVHPASFWTQCTVSVTVWTTVHEHCS